MKNKIKEIFYSVLETNYSSAKWNDTYNRYAYGAMSTAAGYAVGTGAGHGIYLLSKTRKTIKSLEDKAKNGKLSKEEYKKLNSLKEERSKLLRQTSRAGAAVGAFHALPEMIGTRPKEGYSDEDKYEEELLYSAQEDEGAKSRFHKRNKYMGLMSPLGAIGNHFTKSGKARRELIKKAKTTDLTNREKQELRKLNHVRTKSAVGDLGGYIIPIVGSAIGAKILRSEVHKRNVDSYNDEDSYDGGMGGTGAGSPGMSSVGNMGGSTNRGLRPLRKDEESKAKQFVINKMLKSGYK